MFWKDEIVVDAQSPLDNHIDVVVDQEMDDAWRFTGFCGNFDTASREDS